MTAAMSNDYASYLEVAEDSWRGLRDSVAMENWRMGTICLHRFGEKAFKALCLMDGRRTGGNHPLVPLAKQAGLDLGERDVVLLSGFYSDACEAEYDPDDQWSREYLAKATRNLLGYLDRAFEENGLENPFRMQDTGL